MKEIIKMKNLKAITLGMVMAVAISAAVGCAPKTKNTVTTKVGTTTVETKTEEKKPVETNSNSAVQTPANSNPTTNTPVTTEKTFTLAELAKFNGKNGAAAYVAVNGIVYDVTNVSQWKNGAHKGYEAGVDLTEAFKNSPHQDSIFNGIPIVGKLAN